MSPGQQTGWRMEWITRDGLVNFNGTRALARRCLTCGKRKPHDGCECGIRVVPELETLAEYLKLCAELNRHSNMGDLDPSFAGFDGLAPGGEEHLRGMAICKVRTNGDTHPGILDDPAGTHRAWSLDLLAVYARPKHLKLLAARHPVATKPLRELPVSFPIVSNPRIENINTIEDRGNEFIFTIESFKFVIHKRNLLPEDVYGMVMRIASGEDYFDADYLYQRLVGGQLGWPSRQTRVGVAIGTAKFLAAMAHREDGE